MCRRLWRVSMSDLVKAFEHSSQRYFLAAAAAAADATAICCCWLVESVEPATEFDRKETTGAGVPIGAGPLDVIESLEKPSSG